MHSIVYRNSQVYTIVEELHLLLHTYTQKLHVAPYSPSFCGYDGVELLSHCHRSVGNGLCTKFWKDLWIGDTRLCDLFPRIYALENNKDAMVAEKLYSISASFRRSVRGGAEASQLDLLQ
ncbi:hypothetical protein Tco_0292332 [Tanacetum coccineum]